MKIVIEIDEEDWKDINDIHFIREDLKFKIGKAIMKGKPLPKGHGRLIDADWVKNTLDLYTLNFDGIYKQFIRRSDIDTVPTIIEGSDTE